MNKCTVFLVILLGMGLLVGCKSKDEAAPTAPAAKRAAEKSRTDALKAAKGIGEQITQGADVDKAVEQTQTLLEKIAQLIKGGKLGEAETELKGLESKKASLSESEQGQIKASRVALDVAKAKERLKVPSGIPGLPK